MKIDDFDLKAHVDVVSFFWDESKKIASRDHLPHEFQIELTKMMFQSYLSEIDNIVTQDEAEFPAHV